MPLERSRGSQDPSAPGRLGIGRKARVGRRMRLAKAIDDSLFPTWPAQDPVLAIWVFVATMGLLLLPKLLSLVLVWTQRSERRQFGGALRASAGAFAEIVVSALMAPVMMLFQSIAVIEILAGRDAGWQTQRRDDGTVERRELYRKYGIPTASGVVTAASAYAVSLPLLLWMSSVIAKCFFARLRTIMMITSR